MRFRMICILIAGLAAVAGGCCTPAGCGPGCAALDGGCYDCDGGYDRPLPTGPLDALRQARRSLVCGGGCGEVYYGEWISTPPHAHDPCCGTEFTGCASRCTPFCLPHGSVLAALTVGLYGKRFDAGCGCESACDDCCDSCGPSVVAGEMVPAAPGGCSSCAANARMAAGGRASFGTRMATKSSGPLRGAAAPPARTAAHQAGTVQTGRPIR